MAEIYAEGEVNIVFCMVSLDPELSKLFILLMSTSATFGSQNGPTSANFRKRKLETSFLQHESKIEDSLRFFPDKEFELTERTRLWSVDLVLRLTGS